ncbi:MAG: hypothetical protein PHE51_06210 [Eubacteriales bacterium]|nr:hypothetical protein [Eubacteriales bacterium]
MKFSVGYQLREENESTFVSIVDKYKESICEVYFPWVNIPSGRGSISDQCGYIDWSAQNQLVADLKEIKKMGIKLNLLLNGNCYGAKSMSEAFYNEISSVLDYLSYEDCDVDIVTTTSPAVAFMIKRYSPDIDVRASVNMRIGTVKGMEYTKHLFDSYYINRDFNRDMERIKQLKAWADDNGKKIYILANSGCMRECSFQTFHDNMVAHNEEIMHTNNIKNFVPYACWNYIKSQENWVSILQNTWIRPEDVQNYEPYVDMMKLATRMHTLPSMVIKAYVNQEYHGNLLDLFEPGYGPALAPYVMANDMFPEDWFERTTACDKQCDKCNYCQSVLEKVLIEG